MLLNEVDFTQQPRPDAVETLCFERILETVLADFRARAPEWNAEVEGDPVAKLLEAGSARELWLRQRFNDVFLATFLAYATGNDLVAIGNDRGVPKLSGETDTHYRERIRLSFYRPAAGSLGSYKFLALSAGAAVLDVQPVHESTGQVSATVLGYQEVDTDEATAEELRLGAAAFPDLTPSASTKSIIIARSSGPLLDAVRAVYAEDDALPFTDAWQVRAPTIVEYTVEAELVLYPGPDAATVLAAALSALSAYQLTNRRIAYDHTLAGLTDALVVGGVQDVRWTSPAGNVVANDGELALCTGVILGVADGRAV